MRVLLRHLGWIIKSKQESIHVFRMELRRLFYSKSYGNESNTYDSFLGTDYADYTVALRTHYAKTVKSV
jgi:hypothetical protein